MESYKEKWTNEKTLKRLNFKVNRLADLVFTLSEAQKALKPLFESLILVIAEHRITMDRQGAEIDILKAKVRDLERKKC